MPDINLNKVDRSLLWGGAAGGVFGFITWGICFTVAAPIGIGIAAATAVGHFCLTSIDEGLKKINDQAVAATEKINEQTIAATEKIHDDLVEGARKIHDDLLAGGRKLNEQTLESAKILGENVKAGLMVIGGIGGCGAVGIYHQYSANSMPRNQITGAAEIAALAISVVAAGSGLYQLHAGAGRFKSK